MSRHSRSRAARRRRTSPALRDALLAELADDPLQARDVVTVETDVGRLLLHAADKVMTPIIAASGTWEAAEGAWLRSVILPADTVIDVGANIGYFSVLAAKAVGPRGTVVAVEPDPANLRLLRANLWQNGCDNVRVVAAAATDARRLLALRRSSSNAGDHQVHDEGDVGDTLVAGVALDDLLDGDPVDVIKIDTQGVDHLVVDGLRRTLSSCPTAQTLAEFWLDGMEARGVDAAGVLEGYSALGRSISVLDGQGAAVPASHDEVLRAAEAAQGRFLNLVLGRVRR